MERFSTDALASTFFIDADHPLVRATANRVAGDAADMRDVAVGLFNFVRDEISYNPFMPLLDRAGYPASATLARGYGYCVQKAIVLAALARAVGIGARLGFADLRNHRVPGDLLELMGTNLFVFHGFAELHLGDRWLKATPAFDKAMCEKHGFRLVAFDARADAVFHATDLQGRPHVDYVRDRGTHNDLPVEEMLRTFRETYIDGNPTLAAKAAAMGFFDG